MSTPARDPGARAQRLGELLPEAQLDLLLVTDLVNVRYLTGFTGTNGLAIVGGQKRDFLTDFRYIEQAAVELDESFSTGRAAQDLLEGVQEHLPDGPVRLGFESADVSVATLDRLRTELEARIELVPKTGLVERLRAVKDSEEVQRIRAASELADAALEGLLAEGLVGRTEIEAALALETHMRRLGARRPSFDSIVAGGAHGALPHASPRPVTIEPRQLVVIDWGAELDGYCSDCTRTAATGALDEQTRTVYALVLEAQMTGLAEVREDAEGREVDAVARAVIEGGGHGEHYGHGLGHGVGLEIHEAPRLSQRSEDRLRAGNVVTVEPGIYLPGRFGVRIEDLVAVTAEGCEILTGLSKELRTVE